MKTVLGINGAAGRMGQRLVALARDDKALSLGLALEAPSHPKLGQDAGAIAGIGPIDVPVRSELPPQEKIDVMIDFSSPEGTMAALLVCLPRRIPLVVATTGHTPAQKETIE